MLETIEIEGIKLNQTCDACPEQYDALQGEKNVGYLRLRHGHFTVHCPDVEGELVFEGEPQGSGQFQPEERQEYLNEAVAAIKSWLVGQRGIT